MYLWNISCFTWCVSTESDASAKRKSSVHLVAADTTRTGRLIESRNHTCYNNSNIYQSNLTDTENCSTNVEFTMRSFTVWIQSMVVIIVMPSTFDVYQHTSIHTSYIYLMLFSKKIRSPTWSLRQNSIEMFDAKKVLYSAVDIPDGTFAWWWLTLCFFLPRTIWAAAKWTTAASPQAVSPALILPSLIILTWFRDLVFFFPNSVSYEIAEPSSKA